ncbi:MAG: hypothetical protein GKC53_00155 [Neisseriaceae bacterium]|nr:MAG: hypothetical protein GKC53_00155 [Neisseriaceae bacterium]
MLYVVDRSAVILRPTQKFLDWLNQAIREEGGDIELTLEQVQANCRVFLVPQRETPEEVVAYVGENYSQLFELEVASWFDDQKFWPKKMDLQTFTEFFQVDVQDEVVDLVDNDLMNSSLVNSF